MDPTKKENTNFILLSHSAIPLELLVPKKWLTYQNLQYFTRNTVKKTFKTPDSKYKRPL